MAFLTCYRMLGLWSRGCASQCGCAQHCSPAAAAIFECCCNNDHQNILSCQGSACSGFCALSHCKTRGSLLDSGRLLTPVSQGIQCQSMPFRMMDLCVLIPDVLLRAAPGCWSWAEHSCSPAAAPSPRTGCSGQC